MRDRVVPRASAASNPEGAKERGRMHSSRILEGQGLVEISSAEAIVPFGKNTNICAMTVASQLKLHATTS
jgi:hypothetical protein